MCRRNGRGGRKIVAAIQENHVRLKIPRNEASGGWGWRQSMGIWEAGPTVIVYPPASRETDGHRLLYTAILPDHVGARRPN